MANLTEEEATAKVMAFVERLNRSLRTRNFAPFLDLFVESPTLSRAGKGVKLSGREALRDFYRKSPPEFTAILKEVTTAGERWVADCEVTWRQLPKPLRERLWFTLQEGKIAALEIESPTRARKSS